MVKIKRKVEKNLPQLIEWAQDNIEEATKKVYRVNENEVLGDHVRFTEVYSDLEVRLHGYIPFDTIFEIEVEETVTEDTVFEYLINVYRGNGTFMELDTNECINEYNVANLTEVHAYIDGEFKLIWCDGKLVE